jgi:hypothetical protein
MVQSLIHVGTCSVFLSLIRAQEICQT